MLKNHFLLLSMLKTVVLLNIFVLHYFQDSFMNRNDKISAFEIEIFCELIQLMSFLTLLIHLMCPCLTKQFISYYIIFYYILAEWLKKCHKKFTSENYSSALDALSKRDPIDTTLLFLPSVSLFMQDRQFGIQAVNLHPEARRDSGYGPFHVILCLHVCPVLLLSVCSSLLTLFWK